MRVLEAIRLVRADYMSLPELWAITTQPERVQIALILGEPEELPPRAATPESAWNALNVQQRRLVLAHAPLAIRARLPDDPMTGRCTTRRPPHRASAAPARRGAQVVQLRLVEPADPIGRLFGD